MVIKGQWLTYFYVFSRIFGVCARVFTSIWGVAVRKILNHRDQFAFFGKKDEASSKSPCYNLSRELRCSQILSLNGAWGAGGAEFQKVLVNNR